jgi:hypothetical protein
VFRVNGTNVLLLSTNAAAAFGARALATNAGAFVFADAENADFGSTATNQFSVRAQGGARFVTGGAGLSVDGAQVLTNGSALPAARLTGTLPAGVIAAGTITGDKLAAGSVGGTQLAAGAVTSGALANGAVTIQKLQTLPSMPLLTTFTNPTPAIRDAFGFSVAAVGTDRILIGAYRDDTGATNAGAAYLFSINGTLLTTFTNPTPADFDIFGESVAAVGTDRVLIGAYQDDTGATNAGAAYLFSTNGTLLTTFTNPTPENFDDFGESVAAVGPDWILIGASEDDTGATDAGTAYLFTLNGAPYVPGLISQGVVDQSITAAALAPGAVTADKFSAGAVLSALAASNVNFQAGNTVIGAGNVVSNNIGFSTIAGGGQTGFPNSIGSGSSFIGAGNLNRIGTNSGNSAIGAGFANSIEGYGGFIGSGNINRIGLNADRGVIAGGDESQIAPNVGFGTIPGGQRNFVGGSYGFAAGRRAKANHAGAFVWADSTDADFASSGTNQFLVRAGGGVGINTNNPNGAALAVNGTVTATGFTGNGGGLTSLDAAQLTGTVPAGALASVPAGNLTGSVPAATLASVPAGNLTGTVPDGTLPANVVRRDQANTFTGNQTVGGTVAATSFSGDGSGLTGISAANVTSGTVPAAALDNAWKSTGNAGINPAVNFLGTTDNQPLEFKVNGTRGLRLEPAPNARVNVIGGYSGNVVSGSNGGTIAGGGGPGLINQVTGNSGAVGGGSKNTAGVQATVAGGGNNTASAVNSTVSGGSENTAAGAASMVPGGFQNTAAGMTSFAAGYRAKANHDGAFVWADRSDTFSAFASTADHQFLIRAAGGVGIGKNNPTTALDVAGTVTATSFSGDGSGLTSLDAAQLTGTVPSATLASVPAENLTGIVPDGTLSANVARRNAANTFAGEQTVQGNLIASGLVTATGFSGDGSGLTGVAKLGSANTFAAGSSFNGTVTATSFSGNGSALTGVAALGVANAFLSDNTFLGLISADTVNSSTFVRVDARGLNNGAIFGAGAPGLTFGGGSSGEGIASKRTAGGNQFGLDFYTGYTARLSIQGNGNVGIGRIPTANRLEVEGNASKTTAGSWLGNSDRRIKQDIQTVESALDTLNRVRLVSFRYTDDYRAAHPSVTDRPYLNVIAQEFAEVFPDHVQSSGEKLPDGSEILQVDTYPLTIYSAAAVQELAAKVESGNRKAEEREASLRAELQRRDAKIAALEARLEKLERMMEAKGGKQ